MRKNVFAKKALKDKITTKSKPIIREVELINKNVSKRGKVKAKTIIEGNLNDKKNAKTIKNNKTRASV